MRKKQKHLEYDEEELQILVTDSKSRSLMAALNPNGEYDDSGMRLDSVEDSTVFFARELDYVKSQSYDRIYPEMTALKLFPTSSEVDVGAETVTHYSYDKTGVATLITNYSDDFPRADVKGKPTTSQIKAIGVSYGYNVQEMRASRYKGKSLDARKAESAKFQVDNLTNAIAWRGYKEFGLLGVLSPENDIPLFALDEGASGSCSWADKTPDEILDDVNRMQQQVSFNTKAVENPNTLILPHQVYIDISNRKIDNTGLTVRKFLEDNAPFITNITYAPELQSNSTFTNPYAEADGTGLNVAVLCTPDAEKLTIEIPLPFYQHPVQPSNLELTVPCESRVAGAIIYYPLSALIIAGI